MPVPHRAHQAVYTKALMNQGEALDWSICGIDDAWPVVCEPFVQWALADKFVTGCPISLQW